MDESQDLVFILMVAAFLAGSIFNVRRFATYTLVVLIVLTPLYGTVFMPRQVLGVTGLNIWNVVWMIAVAAVLAGSWGSRSPVHAPKYFSIPMVLFVAGLFLATAYALTVLDEFPNIGAAGPSSIGSVALTGWVKPMQFLVVGWLVYRHCLHVRDTRPISRAMLVSIIVFGTLVLYLYWSGTRNGFVDAYGTYVTGRDAVSAMSGMHANDVGAWAVYGLVFAILDRGGAGVWLQIRRLAVAMASLAVVFSFSRTAYVAAPLALLFAFRGIRMREKVVVMLAVGIVVAYTAPLIIERATFRIETRNVNEISSGRVEGIWKPLWKDVEERPILGAGRFAQIRSDSFPRIRLMHAHSAYLQILLEMGAVGLVIVLSMLGRMFAVGVRAHTALPCLLFVCCLVGITGHSFIPDNSNFMIWSAYGISLALIALSRVDHREGGQAVTSGGTLPVSRWFGMRSFSSRQEAVRRSL